jgi:hypothetical protein
MENQSQLGVVSYKKDAYNGRQDTYRVHGRNP